MKRNLLLMFLVALVLALAAAAQSTSTQTTRQTTATRNVPAGTRIQVRINESLSSATNASGDRFTGTITEPVVVAGRTVFVRGAQVQGQVREAKPSGRLTDSGELSLDLTEVVSNGVRTPIYVQAAQLKGENHQKGNIYKIGGGTALGAIIGGIAGGGKGAAIGAGVGAAAGTGAAAATGRKEATVEAEAILEFTTVAPSESSRSGELVRRDGTTSATSSSGSTSNSGNSNQTYGTNAGSTSTTGSQTTGSQSNSSDSTYGNTSSTDYNQANATFSTEDRRMIRDCFRENAANIPASWTRGNSLSAADARNLQRGNRLPASLGQRVQFLPRVCEHQLPRTEGDYERVVFGGKVMLLDENERILDVFDISGQQ